MTTLTMRSKLGWKIGSVRRKPRTDPQPTLSSHHVIWPVVIELEGVDEDDVDVALSWAQANLGPVSFHDWSPSEPWESHDCPSCFCDDESDPSLLFMHVRVLGLAEWEDTYKAVNRVPVPETRRELQEVAA